MGRKTAAIEVEHVCPQTGKACKLKLKKVTDTPAVPAETHWDIEVVDVSDEGTLGFTAAEGEEA